MCNHRYEEWDCAVTILRPEEVHDEAAAVGCTVGVNKSLQNGH